MKSRMRSGVDVVVTARVGTSGPFAALAHHQPFLRASLLAWILFATSAAAVTSQGGSGSGSGHGRPGTPGTSSGRGHVIAILPDGTLRELCTSYTQVTESPFTIAEGRTEAALDAVSTSWAKLDTIRSRAADAGRIGVTRGLPGRWDAEAAIESWSGLEMRTGPVTGEVNPAGFGGGSIRARHTFSGVDSAGVALGLVATIRMPAASSSPGSTEFEGVVSLPVSASLPLDITLGAMTQVGTVADAEDSGRHLRWIDSVKLEREMRPHVSCWLEGVGIWDREPGHPWLRTVNGGFSVDLWSHVDLSLGAAAGQSAAASDFGFFGGAGLHL